MIIVESKKIVKRFLEEVQEGSDQKALLEKVAGPFYYHERIMRRVKTTLKSKGYL